MSKRLTNERAILFSPLSRALKGKRAMIKFLANLFRGLSYVLGVTAPPPEQDQRSFVFMWLGIVALVVAFCIVLFYALSRMHLP